MKHTKYLVTKTEGRAGTGDWEEFPIPLSDVFAAADNWKTQFAGIAKPWLCWNINDRWCLLQQRLLLEIGWTPIVGFDPRIGPPATLLPGARLINFNAELRLPTMWPHFPLEFVFLYAPRLAFWHADLLVRMDTLQALAAQFEHLPDGQTAAVLNRGGRRNFFNRKAHRYWELIGCTTRWASADQFRQGAGWWRHIEAHPSCTDPAERSKRANEYYDSGIGIRYWKDHYGGRVTDIPLSEVEEGHCTAINRKEYRFLTDTSVFRPVGDELDLNYDLAEVASRLGLDRFLKDVSSSETGPIARAQSV